ncbi:MAG: DUF2586 family protein [Polyangiaceae bacterium]|nr:DUF2586 family protein [Polyangiaceae bacterium]
MAKLSGVYNEIGDGALGAVPASVENEMVVFGVATGGDVNRVFSCNDKNAAVEYLKRGPLAQAAVYLLAAGAIKVVPVEQDLVGTMPTEMVKEGDGPEITLSGAPNDNYVIVVTITKNGAAGVAEFKYSLNGGRLVSGYVQVPVGGTYEVPGAGVVLGFSDVGTFTAGTIYKATCSAPSYSMPKLNAAIDAFLATPYQASLFFIVGTPSDATATADLVTAVQSKLSAAEKGKRYIRAIVESANVEDEALLVATKNTSAKRVVCCAGFCELYSDIDGAYYDRSAAWPVARRALATRSHVHVGRVRDGTLDGVRSLVRDERVTPALGDDVSRFCVLRTYVETPGFFVEDDFTMAQLGSDYAQLRNGRVMDKALRIADSSLVQLVHDDFQLASDGTIAEYEAQRIESQIEQAIHNGIVAPGNASAIAFSINRFEDVASTRTIRCSTRIQVRPDAKWIEHDIAFTRTLGE